MKSSRRLIVAALAGSSVFAIELALGGPVLAGVGSDLKGIATSQPAVESTRSPADQVIAWQDDFDRWTSEQAMSAYAVHNDVEKAMAKSMADNGVVAQRLIRLARERWGEKAEIDVAHACGTDARADDATAKTDVNGDHATIHFHCDDIMDAILVREHGGWKIDVAAYVAMVPGTADSMMHAIDKCTKLTDQAMADVNAGKYASADALAKDVREKIAAVAAE